MADLGDNTAQPLSGKLRLLLIGVCAALLGLLVVSGGLAVRYLDRMHAQEIEVNRALAERTQMLSGLWLSIQTYNQAIQQFVDKAKADQDKAKRETERQQLDQLTLAIDTGFQNYPADRDTEEAALLLGMRDLFARQRTLYITILRAAPEDRRRAAQNLTAQSAAPVQQQILDWSQKMRAWNAERLLRADRSLASEFDNLQGGLTRTLAIAFASGLLLVLASMIYIVRLERQTRLRYLQLARSQHELQQLSSRLVDAQESERRSISRELHDEIGQSLGALLVDIGRLSSAVPPEFRTQISQMKSVAERTIQEVRNIALLLRPSMLDDLGLAAALEWQGREVSRNSDIEVTVDTENVPDDLPDDYSICIYRLVQEALNNAVRHSNAKSARVAVDRTPGALTVRVTDDGKGFDTSRSRGLGMLGMEERVKRLDGSLSVESRPGQGTTVIAHLPFPIAAGTAA